MSIFGLIFIGFFGWLFYRMFKEILKGPVPHRELDISRVPAQDKKTKRLGLGLIFAFCVVIVILSISGSNSPKVITTPWLPKLKSSYINSCHVTFSFSVASQLQKHGKDLSTADATRVSQKSFNYCSCLADEIEERNSVDVSSAYFNTTESNNLPENISKIGNFVSSREGQLISDRCVSNSF